MKVALSGIDLRDGALLSKVKKTLESLTVKTQIMKDDDNYHCKGSRSGNGSGRR